MGAILPPAPVLCLVAVTGQTDAAFDWAAAQVMERFGRLQLSSERFPFTQTNYYTGTMGTELRKQFVVPAQPLDPVFLSSFKVTTNEWEEQYRQAARADVERPINLDPGYLSQDKLVLASTKNHAHRLYLDHGIYAELTLQYRAKAWQKMPWTYPDYLQPEFHTFFTEARDYLRSLA